MAGTNFWKLERRCRACGILCYKDQSRHWVHETEPPSAHDPDIRWFGPRPPRPGKAPPASGGEPPVQTQ